MERLIKRQRCKKKLATLQQVKIRRKLSRNFGKLLRTKKATLYG